MAMMREIHRVVVTGLGLVTPLGTDVSGTWTKLVNGESGIGGIQKWGDLDQLKSRYNLSDNFPLIAGEVKGFDFQEMLRARKGVLGREDVKRVKQMDPFIAYACAASLEAVADAGLALPVVNSERTGVAIGSGQGGAQTWEEQYRRMAEGKRLSPFFIPRQLANLASGNVSILLGARGINLCPSTACASGAHAIGAAFRAIQLGYNDAVVAGGTEAAVTPLNVGGFHALRALSTRNREPAKASRPFDRDRDGFVMAEGAGVMVLENLRSARQRQARVYAEVRGYAETSDAHHITEPDINGPLNCMRCALEDAGMAPGEIDFISSHATSTPIGDMNEARALMAVFGKTADGPLVTANKSQLGHTLGAAGAIEAVLSVLSLREGCVPPVVNLECPSEECEGVNYVLHRSRNAAISAALSNSFGFGGTNACLIFTKPDGD
jgi:3-oxoacyl-[acyl-carrier-protein] synthase II